MDSGKEIAEMAMEYRHGQMELVIRVSGRITKPMAKVNLFMSMGIFMRGSGNKIKPMASECMFIRTGLCMRAIGETTIRTDMV